MDFMVFQYPMITVQACLDGILLGILFALIAYGMALQWGVMNIINIAQGDLVILGGYIAYFMYLYGIHPAWGVIVSPIIMYFVAVQEIKDIDEEVPFLFLDKLNEKFTNSSNKGFRIVVISKT